LLAYRLEQPPGMLIFLGINSEIKREKLSKCTHKRLES